MQQSLPVLPEHGCISATCQPCAVPGRTIVVLQRWRQAAWIAECDGEERKVIGRGKPVWD
jgi:hypothetical protein